MTRHEFNNTGFHSNTWVEYKGELMYVIAVDFEEGLFALVHDRKPYPADEWTWARCESVSKKANLKVVE